MGISCLKNVSKGFLVGGDNGSIALWVRHDENPNISNIDNELYTRLKVIMPKTAAGIRKSPICTISINKNDDKIIVSYKNNDLAKANISQCWNVGKQYEKDVTFEFL